MSSRHLLTQRMDQHTPLCSWAYGNRRGRPRVLENSLDTSHSSTMRPRSARVAQAVTLSLLGL